MFAVGSTLTNSSENRDNPYVKVALRMTKPYTLRMLLLLRVFVLRCWAGWVVVLDLKLELKISITANKRPFFFFLFSAVPRSTHDHLTPKKRAKNSVSKKTNANKTSFKPALTHC